jgi:hypothetical protein
MSRYIQEISRLLEECILKVREIIKIIEADGWYIVANIWEVIASISIRKNLAG